MAESDGEGESYERLVAAQNRKHKKAGGFQSFGLDHAVYKAILKKGYKAPTPIQRKAIPLLLDGKDVVAMARTGSGKTAAFLLPLFQRLKRRNAKLGVRALLISPTRELALQTFKFFKELSKFTGLRAAVLVGGDPMEEHFAAIHENPDAIIATPGRLLHVAVEMNLKLKSVEYVVFDEADRLFEIGFEEQLMDVLKRLPENRQTSLFSATLPKSLVDFARAGLNRPTLIRLDVDSKLSDQLKMSFISCRSDDKIAVLLHLIRSMVEADQRTIIFVATKHHVEYVRELLSAANYECSYIYSSLDSVARREQIETFRRRNTNILVSTDLAARGVDIPLLDVAINFHFPPRAKLFVHRVGRVARAGRSGRAYNIVSPEEMPFVMDLFLFLGRSLKLMRNGSDVDELSDAIGGVPRTIIDDEEDLIRAYHESSSELQSLKEVASNAYRQYVRSRPTASAESVKRAKCECVLTDLACHPIFTKYHAGDTRRASDDKHAAMLSSLKNYKANLTVFEFNSSNKHETWKIMKAKRAVHEKRDAKPKTDGGGDDKEPIRQLESANQDDIKDTFAEVIETGFRLRDASSSTDKKRRSEKEKPGNEKEPRNKKEPRNEKEKPGNEKERPGNEKEPRSEKEKPGIKKEPRIKKLKPRSEKDETEITANKADHASHYFIPYRPSDFHSEKGLALEKTAFEKEAESAVLDFTGDDERAFKRKWNEKKWDRKKKKFVNVENSATGRATKKIRTESGVWIPATYKSDLYEKWKTKKRATMNDDAESASENESTNRFGARKFGRRRNGGGKSQAQMNPERAKGQRSLGKKSELKRPENILKERKRKAAIQSYQRHRRDQKHTKGKHNRPVESARGRKSNAKNMSDKGGMKRKR